MNVDLQATWTLARPTVLDLFGGVGGLSLGFEQAGFDVVAAVDSDPVHAVIHQYNFPLCEMVCADLADEELTSVPRLLAAVRSGLAKHGRAAEDRGDEIDVIIGGPPCQGFSPGGKRDARDDRNALVFQFARIVEGLVPKYFVLENVPGMAGATHGATLQRLLARLRLAGYEIPEPKVLNTKFFGVPQDRKRLIVVGTRVGYPIPSYPERTVTPVFSDACNSATLFLPCGPTVWDALSDLFYIDRQELYESDEATISESDLAEGDARASAMRRCSAAPRRTHTTIRTRDLGTADSSHRRCSRVTPTPLSRGFAILKTAPSNRQAYYADSIRTAFATPCGRAPGANAAPIHLRVRSIRTRIASSPFAKRLDCTPIPTGSALTAPDGTVFAKSGTVCRHCSLGRSPHRSLQRLGSRWHDRLGASSSTVPSCSQWTGVPHSHTSALPIPARLGIAGVAKLRGVGMSETNRPPRKRPRRSRLRPADRERVASVARALADYYNRSGRRFPWREYRDPYRVAVAEVLLTKTRADSIVLDLVALLEEYPDPAALARANFARLERSIRHLGLSRKRAANLIGLGCALDANGLETLRRPTSLTVPGIGVYGAAAIACFAFGEQVGIVDANVRRVLERVFNLRPSDIRSTRSRLHALADAIAKAGDGDSRAVNFGILDLGAMLCTPRPCCDVCPLRPQCAYGSRTKLPLQ